MARASNIMACTGVIVACVTVSSGVSAESTGPVDRARALVERARATSEPAWQGWHVVRGASGGVQVRQGAWVLTAQRAERVDAGIEFQERVLLSGPEYSVRTEALTLTSTQAIAHHADVVWRSGESMSASQVTVNMPAGDAEVIAARVGRFDEKSEQ